MSESVMIERIARLLGEADEWHRPHENYAMFVRLTLGSLREVTKEMVAAGEIALENATDSDYDSDGDGNIFPYTTIRSGVQTEIFQAMIDEALQS